MKKLVLVVIDAMKPAMLERTVVGGRAPVLQALMERGPAFAEGDFERIARDFALPPIDETHESAFAVAQTRVRDDIDSAQRSGALVTPAFFINGRRYAGTWDESSLADAMLAPLGHRIQSAAFEFVRWGPSSGLLLGLATVIALIVSKEHEGRHYGGRGNQPAPLDGLRGARP